MSLKDFYNSLKFIQQSGYVYYVAISLILSAICYLIFLDLNWLIGDDIQFETIFNGNYLLGWSGAGRFWPLGLFDYNILKFVNVSFGETVPFYVYNAIIMVISSFILFHFFNKIDNDNYILSFFGMLLVFTCSSFIMIHMDCVYPEHFMFFTLVIFMIFYWKGFKEQNSIFYAIALLSACYTVFCKEPVFLIFSVIASFNILFMWNNMSRKDKWFNLLLIAITISYLLVYVYHAFFVEGFLSSIYEGGSKAGNSLTTGKTLFSASISTVVYIIKKIFLKTEPFLILFFVLSFIRLYFVIIETDRKHLFFDGLLFGGIAYTSVFIYLLMSCHWYFLPVMILEIPVIVYWMNILKGHFNKKFWKYGLIMSCVACSIASAAISQHSVKAHLAWRKETSRITDRIIEYYNKEQPIVFVGQKEFDRTEFATKSKMQKNISIMKSIEKIDENIIPLNALVVTADPKVDMSKLINMGFSLIEKQGTHRMYCVQ
ncbi:MAG: hypothetical protein IJ730_07560 [Alphaproteobacteria bacterium]|nr:hypothetical protein [Alphaproteobacteria bacterium]